jgi:hypothetical protein
VGIPGFTWAGDSVPPAQWSRQELFLNALRGAREERRALEADRPLGARTAAGCRSGTVSRVATSGNAGRSSLDP